MKSFKIFFSIFQVCIGALGILSFIILSVNGMYETKWMLTAVLALLFLIIGIKGIADEKRKK